jgi:hypothetical protein
MKNKWLRIGLMTSLVLILVVGMSGCITQTATPTPTEVPTTVPTKVPTALPTAKPTATPKSTEDKSVDSDVQTVVNNMESSQGYTVVTPAAYLRTDGHGDRMFTVVFMKNGNTFNTVITKSSTYATANEDYNSYVATAKADGFVGSTDYLSGYTSYWMGFRGSTNGIGIGILTSNDWVIEMTLVA